MRNNLKRRLLAGESALGTFLDISSPVVVEIAAAAGFDFVVVDTEHGPLTIENAEAIVRAAEAAGIGAVVRVRENDPPQIMRALDIGATGVQIPLISTGEDAERAAKSAKYAPLGMRGLHPATRAVRFGKEATPGFTDRLNEETMVVIHIEGIEGVRNIDAILAVPHIDVIFIGPYDLSCSLGVPGQADHPQVKEAIRTVVEKANAAGKIVGFYYSDAARAKEARAMGIRYITVGIDQRILLDAFTGVVETAKG
jgi:4-hydroxy-2-oxoheptanedioate aldolase